MNKAERDFISPSVKKKLDEIPKATQVNDHINREVRYQFNRMANQNKRLLS